MTVARPIPRLDPVTSAVLFIKLKFKLVGLSREKMWGRIKHIIFDHFSRHSPIQGLETYFITNFLLLDVTKSALQCTFRMFSYLSRLVMHISLDRQKR